MSVCHHVQMVTTCHIADGQTVLVQLGVRVGPLQADSLLRVALRHLLSPQPHRPQCREVSDIDLE